MIMTIQKNFKPYHVLSDSIITLAVIAIGWLGAVSFHQEQYMMWGLLLVVGIYVGGLVLAWAYQKNTRVEMGEESTMIYRGRLVYRETCIPNDKIYAITKRQNWLQRQFKISSLEIQTSAKVYDIDGVTEDAASALTDMLRQQ